MRITSRENKKMLKEIWPDLWRRRLWRHTYTFDKAYWLPKLEEVEAFLKMSDVNQMMFVSELADCDKYALLTNAEAKKARILMRPEIPREEWVQWAFGEVAGLEFRGIRAGHMVNVCITQDEGVLLIDVSKGDRIWTPRASHDHPTYIRF